MSAGFMKKICNLPHCSKSVLGIILSSMQQQFIGVDYGVFAIAFAVNILNGFAETGKCFHVRKMRLHLLKCSEEEEFTLFLRIHKHTSYQRGVFFT